MDVLHKNHPEFGEYTKYDTLTGKHEEISLTEFFLLKSENKYRVFNSEQSQTHTSFPRRIYFQITHQCNLFCDYCFIKAGKNEEHLEKTVIIDLVQHLAENGLMEVRLTGGEPTLHPDFQEIYLEFIKKNIFVSVATNGLWSPKTIDFFKSVSNLWLIVSVDGTKETHNSLRPDSYDTIIGNLKLIKKINPSVRIRLNTVLSKRNINDLEHLSWLTNDLNAESITLIPLRPQVRDKNALKDVLCASEFKKSIESMVEYKKKFNIQFTTTLETTFKDEIFPDKLFSKKSSCAAGREGTNLDFDCFRKKMIVYACSYCPASDLTLSSTIREPFVAGEFDFNKPYKFKDIWSNDSNWALFRNPEYKHSNCKNCDEFAQRCTGSCPIQNLDLEKVNVEQDIKIQLKEQIQNTAEWYCYKKIFSEVYNEK